MILNPINYFKGLLLEFLLGGPGFPKVQQVPIRLGELALKQLRAEALKESGEAGENNRGPDILRFGRGVDEISWCAALQIYCIEEAWAELLGFDSWEQLPHKHRDECPIQRYNAKSKPVAHVAKRFGRLLADYGQVLEVGAPVEVGDYCIFQRGKGTKSDAWKGHTNQITRTRIDGLRWWCLDGNVGRFPSVVHETGPYQWGKKRLLRVIRI